ncbi:hypothetical protein KW868_05135 [Acinetobacter guillouiae]|uniref:Uncharacterized protein n=1 Tax=Acinetobacter guillouiae TaxID=106649 RepID=A0A8X8GF93_ACIGI|nr:hypothetical protein [Acinetobacter guillouiae]
MNLIFIIIFSSSCFFTGSLPAASLIQLDDTELSEVNGQALMSLSYIAPVDSANKMQGESIGFYKLGLEADLELNANIKKLQLGCGGVNGAGSCDIDFDNLSLSGVGDTRDGRAGSSAKLTNPFIEFAIKNPNSSSTREVVGLRLSAEKALGMLTVGTENSATPNGINSLSGYMKIKDTTGLGYTAPRDMGYSDTGKSINGKVLPTILGLPTLPVDFSSKNYNLQLQETTAPIFIQGATILGNRMNTVQLTGYADINQINFSGDLTARVLGLINLQKKVTGNITGLKADITVNQNLGYIHKINLNNPFSLSLQNNTVWWPNADAAAQRGWWMAFDDEIDIGNVYPTKKIDITDGVLKQIVDPISEFLQRYPVKCGAVNCFFGSNLDVGNVHLPKAPVNFPLKDLQLRNQDFAPNCFGTLKFC